MGKKNLRRYHYKQKLILDITEEVSKLMAEKRITKKELAKRIGRSVGYITRFLDGTSKMDLISIVTIFHALDSEITVVSKLIDKNEEADIFKSI